MLMEIPAEKWFPAIKTRRSRRAYEDEPLKKGYLARIEYVCDNFKPFSGARAVLGREVPDNLFKGIVGSYGKIKGTPAFIAFIGNSENPNVYEQAGYTGEGVVLEAETLGLATCWVGGFFEPGVVKSLIELHDGERVIAISPVGYPKERPTFTEKTMTGFGMTHNRKPLSELVTGLAESSWPQWISAALESARLAPSAVNRQPWRFHVEAESITVSVNGSGREFGLSKRLCCGIAMLHIETAALHFGQKGKWEFLKPPLVARCTLE